MSAALAPADPEHGGPADPLVKPADPPDVEIVDIEEDGTKKLPYVKTFNVTWRNRETGVIKAGTFQATRPSIGTMGKIAVLKAQLNGGMVLDPLNDHQHDVVSALHYILTVVPEWWTPMDFFDPKPIMDVWGHVRSWLETFRSGVGR